MTNRDLLGATEPGRLTREGLRDDWRVAYPLVCDRIERAVGFLQADLRSSRIRERWIVESAAEALWAAVDIFTKKVQTKKAGWTPRTTDWFTKHGQVVNDLRGGTVHGAHATGLGMQFGDQPSEAFVWVGDPPRRLGSIHQVRAELITIADLLKRSCFEATGEWHISFS